MRLLTRNHHRQHDMRRAPTCVGSILFFLMAMGYIQPSAMSYVNGHGLSPGEALAATSHQEKEPSNAESASIKSNGQALLPGSRIVIGDVTAIKGDQIQVEYKDSLQPRFLPLNQAKEKGMEIKEGDKIKMVLNPQDLLIDFHPLGHVEGKHKVIRGFIDQEMPVGQERVVIKTQKGETASFFVRPLARSKIASIPVGVDAVFLADETGKIVDATFGSEEAVAQASQEYERMSNLKAPHKRVEGMVIDPLEENTITIETDGGKKWTYPVRPLLKDKIASIEKGERLTLLIDSDNHVIDVAQFPR